jgi:hypothetical protein
MCSANILPLNYISSMFLSHFYIWIYPVWKSPFNKREPLTLVLPELLESLGNPKYGINLSVHKWINKENTILYTKWDTLQHKNDGTLPFVAIWINLEDCMLSEVSQHRKTSTTWSHLRVESKKVDHTEVERRMMITRDWREQRSKGMGRSSSVGTMVQLHGRTKLWCFTVQSGDYSQQ